jgi:hypothetical protein
MRTLYALLVTAACFLQAAPPAPTDVVYLFSSFRGNGEDGLHLAYSLDGLEWKALKQDHSFLAPRVGGELMRDPCITIGPDHQFHMVWTSAWNDNGIGLAHSQDLLQWSEQTYIPLMKHEPASRNCWAPEIFWDAKSKQYIIFWATTITGRFPETEKGGDWNHRIYYVTTKDFTTFSSPALLYEHGFNVIDATIVRNGRRYVMILKDETLNPPAKNLCVAFSDTVTGPWSRPSDPFSPPGEWVEGPSLIQIGEWWIVYFDEYRKGAYGAMRTQDFKSWEDISDRLHFPKGTRHGTAFSVPRAVLETLLQAE